MCGITKDENGNVSGYHIWTWAGDHNYFPYEGMSCDCGLSRYHLTN